ncbi:IS66-like element accessory protein TnpA [Roseateles cellulosilyticus]|uniref:Transposase n=1 Tax=Pelomonas cellulosilytica TaxID=2906762 RepID=A0ABS8XYA4_9BURK|nr:transposase [Pelomonas sp. P8]MCE4556278.1 transposase [Pelomonas sp. P8]
MTSDKKTRRRYSETKKAQVLAECSEPGASVAKVAMAHGINANVVHRWRQLSQGQAPAELAKAREFIALPLPAPAESAAVVPDVRVELRRGPVSIMVTWPVSAAAELAAWTRELLR